MSKSMKIRLVFAAITVFTTLAVLLPTGSSARAEIKTTPTVIRITPPTPVIDEKERLAELAQRRGRVAQSIGNRSMVIFLGERATAMRRPGARPRDGGADAPPDQ